MKKKLISLVGGILVILAGWFGWNQFGASNIIGYQVVLGSVSNLVSVPDSFVYANSTTTGSHLADYGAVVQQYINTDGIETVMLCYSALGGTATSTMYIRQMGSYDGVTYAQVGTSTATDLISATSTLNSLSKNYSFTPGLATTTPKCEPVNVSGYKHTRFILSADNVAADPSDGVQAWVTLNPLDEIN